MVPEAMLVVVHSILDLFEVVAKLAQLGHDLGPQLCAALNEACHARDQVSLKRLNIIFFGSRLQIMLQCLTRLPELQAYIHGCFVSNPELCIRLFSLPGAFCNECLKLVSGIRKIVCHRGGGIAHKGQHPRLLRRGPTLRRGVVIHQLVGDSRDLFRRELLHAGLKRLKLDSNAVQPASDLALQLRELHAAFVGLVFQSLPGGIELCTYGQRQGLCPRLHSSDDWSSI
mmetsp:Transcript_74430/g.187543  ORF Transcript_74430/g.187543 Transcript_74430/m.187543 type:complete len:228 (+) Transcript_74430:1044-1727(+)